MVEATHLGRGVRPDSCSPCLGIAVDGSARSLGDASGRGRRCARSAAREWACGAPGEILILSVHEGPASIRDLISERGDATTLRWYNPLDPSADAAPDPDDDRSAQNAAVAAAMGCLGRDVAYRNDGVEVGVVRPSSPAFGKLWG